MDHPGPTHEGQSRAPGPAVPAILEKAQALGRGSPLVFPGLRAKPMASTALSELLKELGIATVPHQLSRGARVTC